MSPSVRSITQNGLQRALFDRHRNRKQFLTNPRACKGMGVFNQYTEVSKTNIATLKKGLQNIFFPREVKESPFSATVLKAILL